MNFIKKITSAIIISCLIFTSVSFQNVYADDVSAGTNAISEDALESGDPFANETDGMDELFFVLNKAVINGTVLTITFNKSLAMEKVPSTDDFTVEVTDKRSITDTDQGKIGGEIYTVTEDTVYTVMTDTADIVEINVYGNKAIIILADAVTKSAKVQLDYETKRDDEPLQDQSGNELESFSDYEVINITGEIGLPDFVVEKIYNEIDTLSFSEDLARQIYYAMLKFQGDKTELLTASSDIISILQSSETYSGLTDENKTSLCSFFKINDSFFTYSEGKEESIEEAILIHSQTVSYGLTEQEIGQSVINDTRDEIISEKEQELSAQSNGNGMLRAAALATVDDSFTNVKYEKKKSLSVPFQHNSNANERINLSDGILDYYVTDVVLPGQGGLDLVLQRQYSTEEASYYDVTARLQYVDWDTGRTRNSYMQVKEKEKHFAKNADGTIGDYIDSTSYSDIEADFIGTDELKGLYNAKQIDDDGSYYSAHIYTKAMTTDSYGINARQISNPITRNDELWQLGTGWKFNFSYIEIADFYYDYKKLHLSDGREFGVSSNWVNNLGHYTYKDVIFKNEAVSVRGQTSSYSVTYADGKKEYFNGSGRLIAIVDRFGNTISFTYTTVNHKLEMQITDTLGRVISLTNQTTSTGYNKVLSLPGGKTITYVLSHNTGKTIDAFDDMEDFPGQNNEYNLIKVINQAGEETTYNYTDILCDADFAKRFDTEEGELMGNPNADGEYYYWNYYAGLSKITYPTGLTVNYEYYKKRNAWYDYGCIDDIAIKKRYDKQGTVTCNTKEYNYYNQYVDGDGVVTDFIYNADDYQNENWRNWWVSEKDTVRNVTTKYEFDYNRGFCVGESTYIGSDLIQSTLTEYRTFNLVAHPSKTKITKERYDTPNGQPLTTIECYEYDNRGNAISYWPALSEGNTSDTEHKVIMTYNNLYNYLISKTYKQDASTTILEQNVPSPDGKTISQSLVYENGTLKAKTEYSYDTYGNVTETKVYTYASSIAFESSYYTAVIPNSGLNTITVSAIETDLHGNTVSASSIYYCAADTYPGVTINSSTGAITITPSAQPGSVQLVATDQNLSCSAILNLIVSSSTDRLFSCTLGDDIYIPFCVNRINSTNNIIFALNYNADDLDVVDIVCQTKTNEKTVGLVSGSDIEILSCTPGAISLKVNKNIPDGKAWSGVINVFKFKAKVTGQTTVSAEYN